jgi:hypothetical protein
MKASLLIPILAILALSGCSGSKSTIADEKTGYALTREQAKQIVNAAILAYFSPDYVNQGPPDSLTSSGYIRFALDTHTVNVTAFPIVGLNPQGKAREGFGFDVNHSGSMPISGGSKARQVYAIVKRQAESQGEKLALK